MEEISEEEEDERANDFDIIHEKWEYIKKPFANGIDLGVMKVPH